MSAKIKNPSYLTPTGPVSFPHLNKPDSKFAATEADATYHTKLKLPADCAFIKQLAAEGTKQAEAYWAAAIADAKPADKLKIQKFTLHLPFEAELDDTGAETGMVVLKTKTKAYYEDKDTKALTKKALPIFDSKGVPTAAGIFGGSEVKLKVEAVCYCSSASKEYGVSLRLIAVQIIKLAERGGDGSAYGFGKEDGFEAVTEVAEEVTMAPAVAGADEPWF